jgi:hypothetical protein
VSILIFSNISFYTMHWCADHCIGKLTIWALLSTWFFWMSKCFVILFLFLCTSQIILGYNLLILDFKIWANFGSSFVQDF